MYREKEVIEKKDYYWQGRQDKYNSTAEKIKNELNKKRESGMERYDNGQTSTLFSFGSEDWPNAKGYVIALDVYKSILDRKNMSTNKPIEKEEEWLKIEIKKSLEELYS